jgi:hypothetical protein
MSVPVRLTFYEIMQGAHVGVMRQVENMQKQRKARYGAGHTNDWQLNIEGALAEMALAKYLDRYWAKGMVGDKDVAGVQVRSTSYANGRLRLHEDDSDDDVFYLVTGINGVYEVVGWILGCNGKREEFWCDPTGNNRHAYFVPQNALIPLS